MYIIMTLPKWVRNDHLGYREFKRGKTTKKNRSSCMHSVLFQNIFVDKISFGLNAAL